MIKLYKRFLFKKYKLHLIFGPLFKILEAIFELFVPLVIRYMIDEIVNNNLLDEAIKVNKLLQAGGLLILLATCGLITTIIAQYIAAKASQGVGTDLRNELYKHINSLSFKELDKISTPSLINRIQTDASNVESSVAMLIRLMLRAPFIVIGSTIMSLIVNYKAGLIFLGFTILLFLLLFGVSFYITPLSKKSQEKLDIVTNISKENLSGNRVVRAFNKQKHEYIRFVDNQVSLCKIQSKIITVQALLSPLTFLLINVASMLVLLISGYAFINKDITQGDIQALMNYFTQTQIAVVAFTDLMMIFAKGVASANRINEVFSLENKMIYGNVTNINLDNKEAIRFNNVCFKYNEGNNIIDNVSFCLNSGESLGIIGATGSGKSSLIYLLNRFYDVDSGNISLFGEDIKNYNKDTISSLMSLSMQKASLFNGSIKTNLLKGNKKANEEMMINSLKEAEAYDFVFKTNEKLDYEIYQNGKNLSGGQRQRICIARALIKDSPILILDDSTSALDYKTESKVRKNIINKKKTTIIISQRVISIMKLDKILVLDKGKVINIGTHSELLKNCQLYKEICHSQDVEEKKDV